MSASAPTAVFMRRMMMGSRRKMFTPNTTIKAAAAASSAKSTTWSSFSSVAVENVDETSSDDHSSNNFLYYSSNNGGQRRRQPEGELFNQSDDTHSSTSNSASSSTPKNLVGQSGSICRVFGPQSNASAYLTCGGQELAAHASFDPNYDQAKQWIRARPIGSSTISPVLIQGLVGTLVDAAFPQTVPVESSIRYVRPLIVGTEVRASVVVVKVEEQHQPTLKPLSDFNEEAGFEIDLKTQVVRVQDDALIADGTHKVWIPNYLK